MSARCTAAPAPTPAPARVGAGSRRRLGRLGTTIAWLRRALRVAEERRQLAALDDRRMADMGVSEEARQAELRRPFWDID